MHPTPVVILILTTSLYIKNLLHKPILKFKINTIGLTTDSPVSIHQREIGITGKSEAEPREIL